MKKYVLIVLVLVVIVLNIGVTDPSYSMEEELSAVKKELSVAEDELAAVKKELIIANTDINILEDDVEQLQKETLAIEYEELRKRNFFTIMMVPEFFNFIYDNPVDKALKTFEPIEVYATWEIVEVLSDRCELWDAEIQNSILILKEFLTEDDYQELLEGQKAWELYIERSFDIEAALLYPYTRYIFVGSMYVPQVMYTKSQKMRARAIELLGYIYIFTDEVSFVFTEN